MQLEKNKMVFGLNIQTIIVVLLFCLFGVQSVWHAIDKSATYDEQSHLAISYLVNTTSEQDFGAGHPILIYRLQSIPLLFLGLHLPQMELPVTPPAESIVGWIPRRLHNFGAYFVNKNNVSTGKILFCGRVVNIILAIFIGVIVYFWSCRLFGLKAGFLSVLLFSLCPNLIAHSSLATTDIGGICFALLFLYMLCLFLSNPNIQRTILTGLFLGLALASKMSNIVFIPLLVFFCFLNIYIFRENIFSSIKKIVIIFMVAWFVLCGVYIFKNVFIFHFIHLEDIQYLNLSSLFETIYAYLPIPHQYLKEFISLLVHNKRGHDAFLLGQHSTSGWWYYFPIAFFIKTPIITILLCFIGLAQCVHFIQLNKKSLFQLSFISQFLFQIPMDIFVLVFSVSFFLLSAILSHMNIGIRHILIIYPLIYILLGSLVYLNWIQKWFKQFLFVIFILLASEVGAVAPHYLAFFNQTIGGPFNGAKYLSDSNIDWGQDLKSLARYLKKEGQPEVVLSYFGTAMPQSYGIEHQDLNTVWSLHLNSIEPKKEYFAVSVTNLHGNYFAPRYDLLKWLENKEPIAKVGYSIYVYDITNDLESQKNLLEVYRLLGEEKKFYRQIERIQALIKKLQI